MYQINQKTQKYTYKLKQNKRIIRTIVINQKKYRKKFPSSFPSKQNAIHLHDNRSKRHK